jgi:hypothetical protein
MERLQMIRRRNRHGMRNGIAALTFGVFAFSGWIAAISNHGADASGSMPSPHKPSVSVNADPLMARMVNCEDFDIQPCFTWDDGAWRIVLSYSPYKSVKAYDCTAEDGGKKLPCIWRDYNRPAKGKKSDPKTRNVFWKGKLG